MDELDLGHGHRVRFVQWAPDRDLNPQYVGTPDVEHYAAVIEHPAPDDADCHGAGAVVFVGEVQRRVEPDRPTWTVESWEPLTISPSVLCRLCGDHGFIRDGRWVPA